MKSGKAPRNLPTRSRAELSPSSFYTLVQWFRVGAQHKVLKKTVKDKVQPVRAHQGRLSQGAQGLHCGSACAGTLSLVEGLHMIVQGLSKVYEGNGEG